MRFMVSLALAASLTACATNWYVPPTGPTANLQAVANPASPFYVWTRDITRVCSRDSPNFPVLGPVPKADVKAEPRVVGPFQLEPYKFVGRIQAGAPVRLSVGALSSSSAGIETVSYSCNFRITFTPRENATYELRYDFFVDRCSVSVAELALESGVSVKTPVAAKIERVPNACE